MAETKYEELKPSIETIHFPNKETKGFSPERMQFDSTKGISHEHRELLKKIGTEQPLKKLKELLTNDDGHKYFNLELDSLLFLNFNYTSTDALYLNPKEFSSDEDSNLNTKSIHIHGSIHEKDKDSIIFGFGDELDEKYKEIENLNKNEYLENIKSIKYLDTANYKRLLEYVNSDSYQIFIMGHSCGNSDRTLLNTLFEHPNCVSVKVYYHQKNENEDNYSDVIRNISRNFNDKAMFRDKVVNKEYCEPLVPVL